MKQKSKKTGILGIVLIVVMVLLVIGMDVLCLAYQNMINLFFREEVKTDIDAVEARAQEITTDINAEGTVLLKNDGNVLPISEKVNLLGTCSYQQIYLGTGSAGGWNWSADACVNLKDALASEGITVNPDLWQFYIDNYTANDGQTGGATNILDPRDTYADAAEWDVKAKDLASRFIKNFAKYEGNEAGKKLVAAGPKL